MKNKKLIIACIVVMLIIAIGLGAGLNISATKKYESAMELIEEYTSSFETQEEIDEMEHIYDKFLADEKLSSYYGKNNTFDECYDLAKEEMERIIQEEKNRLAEESAKQEAIEDENEETTGDSENTESKDVQTSDEENTSSDTSSSDTKNENTTSSNEVASNEQQISNNTESTTDSSSSSSSSITTSSPYDIVAKNTGIVWHCPAELVKLAPSKGWFCMEFPNGNMYWSTNDYTETKPPYWECEAGPDGVPISGTVYINGELVQ